MVALHYSTLHRFEIFSVPGTIAHGSIRLPPNRWCRQYNRVMLNGYGNENGKKKKKEIKKVQLSRKKQQLCTCCTLSFSHFFAVVVAMWNFRVKHFMEKMSHVLTKNICCLCSCSPFFFTAAHFHLAGRWHFSFSHRRYIISLFFFQRYSSPLFFSLVVALCRSFSRWASLACGLLSRFLCHSLSLHSKFVIMTINIKVMLHKTIRNDYF